MENHNIPEEVMWKQQEAYNAVQRIIEKIKLNIQWEAENLGDITNESYKILQEPDIQSFWEAEVCIKIAQWRAKNLIEKQAYEDLQMDAYIQLRDMISKLKLENGLLIDPIEEKQTIDLYNNPERLREKFRSQALDMFINNIIARWEFQIEQSYKLRQQIFSYLPSYDINPWQSPQ